jgi:exodeoxyribonuclease VIII
MITPSTELTELEKLHLQNFNQNKDKRLDVDDEWYYGDTMYVSNSMLKMLKSHGPEYVRLYLDGKISKDTTALHFGRALHMAVLEPEKFDEEYIYFDDSKLIEEIGGARPTATKKYKEAKEQFQLDNSDKTILSSHEWKQVCLMAEKLENNIQVKQLLEGTDKEVVYQDTIDGIKVKCKVDAIHARSYLPDLKTMSKTPHPANVQKQIQAYDYDMQAALYCDITGASTFWIIAIEKSYPYTIGLYELSEETIEQGREKYQYWLNEWKKYFIDKSLDIDTFCYMGTI